VQLAQLYKKGALIHLLESYKNFMDAILENVATPETVHEFVQKGFSVNFRSVGFTDEVVFAMYGAVRARGATPLHCAIEHKNFAMVQALVEAGADINARDAEGAVPLNYAARHEAEDILRYLLEKEADLAGALNNVQEPKETALLQAAAAIYGRRS
jgi:hypothetical protein